MASETKHTPGNWGYEDPMGPDILTIVANPSDPVYDWIWVAQIGTAIVEDDDGKVIDQRPFWEHEANARLIAAAPDLLAAVKAMDAALCDGFDTQEQRFAGRKALIAARAAIAKAEAVMTIAFPAPPSTTAKDC